MKNQPLPRCLSSQTLKFIAAVTMLIDHTAVAWIQVNPSRPEISELPPHLSLLYTMMRLIGRAAFPIFCFTLVEGYYKTRNRLHYGIRLLILAVLSELPFDLALFGAINIRHQNTVFTLFIGYLTVCLLHKISEARRDSLFASLLQILTVLCGSMAAALFGTDYSYSGILLICVLYLFRDKRWCACTIGFLCLLYEPACILGFVLILLYHGKKGSVKYLPQAFFYLFYPLHLLLLFLLRYFCRGIF